MLFELGGKRKRFIQVIYVFLALLLGVGLVGLGIGGDANGGIFNALGIGGDQATQSDPEYDAQIERAEETLATDPENEQALLTVARYNYLAGQQALETDEAGNVRGVTDESLTRYEASIDAWERYLDTKPKQPDDGVASLMVQAYGNIAGTGSAAATEDQIRGAYEAAQVVAEARPSSGTYLTVAIYAYYSGDEKAAEEARKNALAEAVDSSTKSQINQQLDAAQQQAKLIEKQLAASAPDKSQLEDPFEGLGGTSTTPLPGTTPTPTPTP